LSNLVLFIISSAVLTFWAVRLYIKKLRSQADHEICDQQHVKWRIFIRIPVYFAPIRWGAQNFQKSKRHLKFLGSWMVTWSKFHAEGSQILGATDHKLFSRATWTTGFVRIYLRAFGMW